MSKIESIKENFKKLGAEEKDGIFYYLPDLTEFQKKEITFHDAINTEEKEVHQLNSLRNRYYHSYFKKYLLSLPSESVVLELGAGTGEDAIDLVNVNKDLNLILNDISSESIKNLQSGIRNLSRAKPRDREPEIIFLVADGQNLPLENESIDAVYMVAALHHFEDQENLLNEIKRVIKPGGLIIFAMEPSAFMMKFTKLFKNVGRLRIFSGHSEADESHNGYTYQDFQKLLRQNNLQKVKIKRVWLLQGFAHYFLEGLFRFFKLKKRLKLPKLIEWILLILDELLLKIPLLNALNWHWIVIVRLKA